MLGANRRSKLSRATVCRVTCESNRVRQQHGQRQRARCVEWSALGPGALPCTRAYTGALVHACHRRRQRPQRPHPRGMTSWQRDQM